MKLPIRVLPFSVSNLSLKWLLVPTTETVSAQFSGESGMVRVDLSLWYFGEKKIF